MKFFKEKKKFDVYEDSILRTLSKIHKKVTPSEIAQYLKIHPNTAKKRIESLEKKGYVKCKLEGKKRYCERTNKLPVGY